MATATVLLRQRCYRAVHYRPKLAISVLHRAGRCLSPLHGALHNEIVTCQDPAPGISLKARASWDGTCALWGNGGCHARSRVWFGGGNTFLEGQYFCFYCMLETNISGRNKILGRIDPNAPPWLRAWGELGMGSEHRLRYVGRIAGDKSLLADSLNTFSSYIF